MVARALSSRLVVLAAVLAAIPVLAWLGADKVLVTRMPGESFSGTLPVVSGAQRDLAARLRVHVETLAGRIGERNIFRYPALLEAARYIEHALEVAGHTSTSQTFEAQGMAVRNIEVEIAGEGAGAGIVVIGAHYDSVRGSPGANDNATGVAALLELARLLKGHDPGLTVRLVAFVNEETPFYYTRSMGSVRYAERSAERGERIVAMLSLETIGFYSDDPGSQRYPFPLSFFYPDTGNFIGFVGNLASRSLVRRATSSFRRHARFPSQGLAAPGWLTGVGWSDHWSFWRQGFPAIMVTDTALFRYLHYHTAGDRPSVVDYERFAMVVDGLLPVILDLADG